MMPGPSYLPDPHLIPGRFCPTCPASRNARTVASLKAILGHIQYTKLRQKCCQ